jgi:hypothetical protein
VEFFFEWQKLDAKVKQTYAIGLKNGDLFAFAGLWETWRIKANGQVLKSHTIIPTDANELVEPFHDRMPAILDPQDYERWLSPAEPTHLPVNMLMPQPAEKMKAWKVGDDAGNLSVTSSHPETAFHLRLSRELCTPAYPEYIVIQIASLHKFPGARVGYRVARIHPPVNRRVDGYHSDRSSEIGWPF